MQRGLIDISDVGVDLLKRSVSVGGLHVSGGVLALRRDAKGELDVGGDRGVGEGEVTAWGACSTPDCGVKQSMARPDPCKE